MSNCIHFVGGDVVSLSHLEIDIDRFEAFLKSAKEVDYKKVNHTEEELNSNVAWWFLQQNTRIVRSGKIGAVEIRFGLGRSIHTNRDFKSTLKVLSTFMKKSVKHTFFITDEFDGHNEQFRIPVDLRTGKGLL